MIPNVCAQHVATPSSTIPICQIQDLLGGCLLAHPKNPWRIWPTDSYRISTSVAIGCHRLPSVVPPPSQALLFAAIRGNPSISSKALAPASLSAAWNGKLDARDSWEATVAIHGKQIRWLSPKRLWGYNWHTNAYWSLRF